VVVSIASCRSCGSRLLLDRFDLGNQFFSGYFPSKGENISHLKAPLKVVECEPCSLSQLTHSFEPEYMYGQDYGYRSGLNPSMVTHLNNKSDILKRRYNLDSRSNILDIGSNDGTFLRNFIGCLQLVGTDPTIQNWIKFYDFDVTLISELFDGKIIEEFKGVKFDLITSISMFYDVPEPVEFVKSISNLLTKNGVWHLEQSYLPSMMRNMSFDTVCHEHLMYYSIRSIENIISKFNLKIIHVNLNEVNGGSFELDIARESASYANSDRNIREFQLVEQNFFDGKPWETFDLKFKDFKLQLYDLIMNYKNDGFNISCLGASTKGNVLLQAVGINSELVKFAGEINNQKIGKVTPGTNIEIIPEKDLPVGKREVRLVLPWHFKKFFLETQKSFIDSGGTLVFPLPKIEVINKNTKIH
jgi:hypothetical protein